MKLDRLLGILITLLRQDKITAPVLAEKFEVSRRTINRDIEALCLAGIPLVTEQGRARDFHRSGYKLEKSCSPRRRLQAILIGVRGVDSILKQPKGPVLADKLFQRETEEQVLIDLASFYKDSLTEKISLLRDAISRRLAVSFRYYSEKGGAPAGRALPHCLPVERLVSDCLVPDKKRSSAPSSLPGFGISPCRRSILFPNPFLPKRRI